MAMIEQKQRSVRGGMGYVGAGAIDDETGLKLRSPRGEKLTPRGTGAGNTNTTPRSNYLP